MATILIPLLQIASFLFVARARLSWFRPGPDSRLSSLQRGVGALTEPILAPLRRVLPKRGPFDFSPLAVVLLINLVLVPVASKL